MQCRAVMTIPFGETNDAEQPSGISRNEANRTPSSHCGDGVKPYARPTRFAGKLSKVHMPSSASVR